MTPRARAAPRAKGRRSPAPLYPPPSKRKPPARGYPRPRIAETRDPPAERWIGVGELLDRLARGELARGRLDAIGDCLVWTDEHDEPRLACALSDVLVHLAGGGRAIVGSVI